MYLPDGTQQVDRWRLGIFQQIKQQYIQNQQQLWLASIHDPNITKKVRNLSNWLFHHQKLCF